MGLNGMRSWIGTKTFSAGERRARGSTGLAQGCSLSLADSSLPAAAAGLCVIYIHFFRVTKALKSSALKKNVFVQEAFVDDRKAEQPWPRGSFGDDLSPQTAHGQFGLVALSAGRWFQGCPISRWI